MKVFCYLPENLPTDYLLAADDSLPLAVVAQQARTGLLDEAADEDADEDFVLDSELEDAELERSF